MPKPSSIPVRPQIYHIVHVDNLASIIAVGGLLSDRNVIRQRLGVAGIGLESIKKDRLIRPVDCRPGTFVGDFVPFYFCPRSVMLFILYRANHPDLSYRGGQEPIIHLELDLHEVITYMDSRRPPRRWAFSTVNARARYAAFWTGVENLGAIDWQAVAARGFRQRAVESAKQAELLIHHNVSWHLVSRIGVLNLKMQAKVEAILDGTGHRPPVVTQPS